MGWKGANVIPDPPVKGAIDFILAAVRRFDVAIYSSRSHQDGGIRAMQGYLIANGLNWEFVVHDLMWPDHKPPAMVTIDDRALTFTGDWPDIEWLLDYKPWNKLDV